ncbi:MAG TPA: hypothetical protein VMV37_09795 [Gammaproteobacteria bacterium]|nr:hypothetical protein [Gammaproteobacteria bacterium]
MSIRKLESFVKRYLDPADRLEDLLNGLIMALSITLAVGLAIDKSGSTLQVALTILACNLTTGFVNGGMHIVSRLYDRGRQGRLVEALRSTSSDAEQIATVGRLLDEDLPAVISQDERRVLYRDIAARLRGSSAGPVHVAAEDMYGALVEVWLILLASVPAIAPFLCFRDRFVAARVSNGLALLALFATGYAFGRSSNASPWAVGLSTTTFGLVMVIIVTLLGG